ncbi:MAG: hypothetical protein JOZ45_01075 [Acidobacteriaceae bacterium]|nr:hypothetical protein [Acidobacteriaceae bacterium]
MCRSRAAKRLSELSKGSAERLNQVAAMRCPDKDLPSPLRPKHVWSTRAKLQVDGRLRDLAMFNVAIDSKLLVATLSR